MLRVLSTKSAGVDKNWRVYNTRKIGLGPITLDRDWKLRFRFYPDEQWVWGHHISKNMFSWQGPFKLDRTGLRQLKAKIDGDIENICCSSTWVDLKHILNHKPNPIKAQCLPLFNVHLSQPQLDSTWAQFQLNFDSTSSQPQPQYQPELNINLNLNSTSTLTST